MYRVLRDCLTKDETYLFEGANPTPLKGRARRETFREVLEPFALTHLEGEEIGMREDYVRLLTSLAREHGRNWAVVAINDVFVNKRYITPQ